MKDFMKKYRVRQIFSRKSFICLFVFISIVASSYFACQLIEAEFKKKAKETLKTVLNSINQSINIWAEEQQLIARNFSKNPFIVSKTEALLNLPAKRQVLINSKAQQQVRDFFQNNLKSEQYTGFYIVNSANVNLASLTNNMLGVKNLLINQPEVLKKAWAGNVVFSHLQTYQFSSSKDEKAIKDQAFFIISPIYSKQGKIIAIFILKINPYVKLFKIMHAGYLGKTGETYAIDYRGMMISPSRFYNTFDLMPLLQQNLPNIRIADPGINLLKKEVPAKPLSQWPLTLMAQSATAKQSSGNVDGYRDYRGVPVIGMWTWNSTLKLGITSEQDVAEAYSLLYFVNALIMLFAVFFSLVLVIVSSVLTISARKTKRTERKLASIVETANDAIITISAKRIIQSVNPAAERMFGYKKSRLIGCSIEQVIQVKYGVQGDFIQSYITSGKANAMRKGISADGDLFPIQLGISRFIFSDKIYFSIIIKDISNDIALLNKIKKAQHNAEQERDKYSQVNQLLKLTEDALNRTNIGEFWFDEQSGEIVRSSKKFSDMLGYSVEELCRMHFSQIDANYSDEKFMALIKQLKSQEWFCFEIIAQTKNGRRMPLEFVAVYHRQLNKKISFVIAFVLDITQRKETEAMLILSRKAAEDMNKAKSNFLATMSHEIRTPLNGILSTIDMLNRTELSVHQKSLINISMESADILQRIIDDILDFSKIEAGKLELVKMPIDIEKQLEVIADNLFFVAKKKQVELLIYCDPNIPCVQGDPVRIQQILFNLGGNAVKFSKGDDEKKGKVFIAITIKEKTKTQVILQIKVEDNGIGIDTSAQEKLFHSFSQAEQDTTRRFGGTGLGLTISKRLLDMMNGTITIDSQKGEGTTFSIILPLKIIEQVDVKKILILQDVEVVLVKEMRQNLRFIIREYLQNAGAKVIEKELRHINIASMKKKEFKQILILDTGVKNFEILIEQLNQIEAGKPRIPHLLLISDSQEDTNICQQCKAILDINAMHRETLNNTVAVALGLQAPVVETKKAVSQLNQVEQRITREHAIEQNRLVLLADDNEINRKVIGQQLQVLGYWVDLAKNGQEALALWKKNTYNIILTDYHMPVMDGCKLTRKIRSLEADTEHVPIIAITADVLKGTAQQCYKAGMDDHITKPMQLVTLEQILQKWINTQGTVQSVLHQKQVCVTSHQETNDVIDVSVLAQLLGTDDAIFLKEYYQDFLTSARRTMGHLQQANIELDIVTIRQLAHKLKSSAHTVGAIQLAKCCLLIELAGKNKDITKIQQLIPVLIRLFHQVESWIIAYINRNHKFSS